MSVEIKEMHIHVQEVVCMFVVATYLNTGTWTQNGFEHHEINSECVAVEIFHQFHHLHQS